MVAYTKIDEVEERPKFDEKAQDEWGFTLWSNLIDDEAPHRALLERFVRNHQGFVLTLPAHDRYEDFVEGALSWGPHRVSIWYETILSQLSFWSVDRKAVEELRNLMAPFASSL